MEGETEGEVQLEAEVLALNTDEKDIFFLINFFLLIWKFVLNVRQ